MTGGARVVSTRPGPGWGWRRGDRDGVGLGWKAVKGAPGLARLGAKVGLVLRGSRDLM